jgi:hypothetical protein
MKSSEIVTRYGTMWARNVENIRRVRKLHANGVYILFDGSMPMYVGKGRIGSRVKSAAKSDRRGQMWDHFSWYEIRKPELVHDIEVLMLRMLPPNLRPLTRQEGHFIRRHSRVAPDKKQLQADSISRKIRKSKEGR